MADAQGKLSGRPGICFVTRGPGATNASIGVHTAFQDSTPMILFVGQVASEQRDREAFQEVDYRQMFGPGTLGFAKWVAEIHDPNRVPEYVARAFHTALQGRPGPVVLALPEDMLTTETSAPALPRIEPALAWPAPGALRDVRSMLLEAQRPIVIAGGSGWDAEACKALERFAENWNLPVGCAFRFQDTFDNRHGALRGRCGHRHQSEARRAHQGSRPCARDRPAAGRDDNRRLHAAAAAAAEAEADPHARRAEELGRVYVADLLL